MHSIMECWGTEYHSEHLIDLLAHATAMGVNVVFFSWLESNTQSCVMTCGSGISMLVRSTAQSCLWPLSVIMQQSRLC